MRLQMLRLDVVRPWIPSPLKIVPVFPGCTLGALYLARYEVGSSLEYQELIVAPALVRHRMHIGGWVSHIYVDNEISAAGGRGIWALPKQIAQFQWAKEGHEERVRVTQDGQTLCSLTASPSGRGLRAPIYTPMLRWMSGRLLAFRGTGWGTLSSGRAELSVPATSPFAAFGFGSGRHCVLEGLDLNVLAPHAVSTFSHPQTL